MKLGENIRDLRSAAGKTQEQLASAMGVSYQAVSKWENGSTLPDITLLPRLAVYFGVTTDRLLSFDRGEMDADVRRAADEAFAFRETEPAKARSILENMLEKYPDEPVLLNNLLYTVNYTAEPDTTIAIASKLIAGNCSQDIRYDALRFLAYAHHARGDEAAAVAALEQVPEMYFTKLSEMAFVTTGERKRAAAEKQKWISFETLIQMQWKLAECSRDAGQTEEAAACTRRAIALIEALQGDERIREYDTYRSFFLKQLDEMEK